MRLDFGKVSMYAQNFITYYNGHTQTLSRHSNKTAIDMQVSLLFTDNFLPTLLSHEGPKQTL